MAVRTVYLDTSSIVKRYVEETDSDLVDNIYTETETGRTSIVFSLWNIGEALGVFDRMERTGRIPPGGASTSIKVLIGETRKLNMMNLIKLYPLDVDVLSDSMVFTLKHHIYVGDALQVSTARKVEADLFMTFDEKLRHVAEEEGLNIVLGEKRS